MGMYDYVHYEGNIYQTKDFDCRMLNYHISNGRLLKCVGHWETVPESKRPFPNESEDLFLSMCGCIKWIEACRVDMNFHGRLYFCDAATEFCAKFTDGNLVNVTVEGDDAG